MKMILVYPNNSHCYVFLLNLIYCVDNSKENITALNSQYFVSYKNDLTS